MPAPLTALVFTASVSTTTVPVADHTNMVINGAKGYPLTPITVSEYVPPETSRFEDVVYFDSDERTMTPTDKRLKYLLLPHPSAKRCYIVVGSADQHGTDTYNRQLSADRAKFVAQYLESTGRDVTEVAALGEPAGESIYPDALYRFAEIRSEPCEP